jgi:hypothetical protein
MEETMRALILVAGAVLALSACQSTDEQNNAYDNSSDNVVISNNEDELPQPDLNATNNTTNDVNANTDEANTDEAPTA